jgi:hypothetical protein
MILPGVSPDPVLAQDAVGDRACVDRDALRYRCSCMQALLVVAVVAVVVVGLVAARRRRSSSPVENPWAWEGIRLAFAPEPASTQPPHLVVHGEYMARPSIYRSAVSDWAFSSRPTPILVLFDVSRGVELHRASLDRIHGEYQVRVQGLSISYATPSPPPPVPDDDSRRDGGPFSVDIGFYLEPRDEPWELRIHAELGPLRSDPIAHVVTRA